MGLVIGHHLRGKTCVKIAPKGEPKLRINMEDRGVWKYGSMEDSRLWKYGSMEDRRLWKYGSMEDRRLWKYGRQKIMEV